jgi:Cd2+/Zn2+-exporting ATPase
VSHPLTHLRQEYFKLALVFIVVACPCALVISTPITYMCGMAHLARAGVLVKGGIHLETLGSMRTLCMDKTGTLTKGHFALVRLEIVGALARHEVLGLLAALEQQSTHPMAAGTQHQLHRTVSVYQQLMVTRLAASQRTDNCPQPKEAQPLVYCLTL